MNPSSFFRIWILSYQLPQLFISLQLCIYSKPKNSGFILSNITFIHLLLWQTTHIITMSKTKIPSPTTNNELWHKLQLSNWNSAGISSAFRRMQAHIPIWTSGSENIPATAGHQIITLNIGVTLYQNAITVL
jgi:hypothetical protein